MYKFMLRTRQGFAGVSQICGSSNSPEEEKVMVSVKAGVLVSQPSRLHLVSVRPGHNFTCSIPRSFVRWAHAKKIAIFVVKFCLKWEGRGNSLASSFFPILGQGCSENRHWSNLSIVALTYVLKHLGSIAPLGPSYPLLHWVFVVGHVLLDVFVLELEDSIYKDQNAQ